MQLDHGQSQLVADGSTQRIDMPGAPWTACLFPAAGATATVQISATPLHIGGIPVPEGDMRWVDLQTNIAEPTSVTFPGPVMAVRVLATGGDVTLDFIDSETC